MWTNEADVKQQLERLWVRGDVLRAFVGEESVFPYRLRFRAPSSREIEKDFGLAQDWVTTLRSVPVIRLEWKAFRSRAVGNQRIPTAAWVDSADAAIPWLGKQQDADRYRQLYAASKARLPDVVPWLRENPLRALALRESWTRILCVVEWMRARPRPNIYPRQIDVPNVHRNTQGGAGRTV